MAGRAEAWLKEAGAVRTWKKTAGRGLSGGQHQAGTCRMGNDPKNFVTNKWAQAHDVPNLYICDASIFPGNNDKTTTMPIIAFAMRTCDYMLDNFRRGVHKRA